MLQTISIPWPPALNCSVFPEHNTEQTMCMEFPEEKGEPPVQPGTPLTTTPSKVKPQPPPDKTVPTVPGFQKHTFDYSIELCSGKKKPSAYWYSNSSGECRAKCTEDNLFSERLVFNILYGAKRGRSGCCRVCIPCLHDQIILETTKWPLEESYFYPWQQVVKF